MKCPGKSFHSSIIWTLLKHIKLSKLQFECTSLSLEYSMIFYKICNAGNISDLVPPCAHIKYLEKKAFSSASCYCIFQTLRFDLQHNFKHVYHISDSVGRRKFIEC